MFVKSLNHGVIRRHGLHKSHANTDGLLTGAYLRESVLERVLDGIERFRRSAREAFCVTRSPSF